MAERDGDEPVTVVRSLTQRGQPKRFKGMKEGVRDKVIAAT